MAAKAVSTHGQRTCTVEVTPSEVDAGAELSVKVQASCPEECDLSGQSVSIRNQDDTELARDRYAAGANFSTLIFPAFV